MLSLNLPECTELLYANDLVLMSNTMEDLRDKFSIWTDAFESIGLKVSLWETKVMVSGGITKDGISKSIISALAAH